MRLLKSNSQHKCSRESGATFVEYAIVFPLIFFLFLSFMDFGRWYYYRGLATASAQRGVSLTQLIAGFEDLTMDEIMRPTEKFGVTDHNDPAYKLTVMGGITHKVGNFIEDRVGIQIADSSDRYVRIKPATDTFPLVKVPTWDESAGESLAEKLESEPIEVQFILVMDTFSPWLPEFETEITAAAFYEEAKKSSIPVPVNCKAERVTDFDEAEPADCRCKAGASRWDSVANECICESGATYNAATDSCDCDVGEFDPSAGTDGECVCDPDDCDAATQTQNDISDANPCACVCIDAGGGDAAVEDDGAGGCGCPGSDLVYSGNKCVCPPEPSAPNDCNTVSPGSNWGYDPGTQTCKCINCPTGQKPDGSGGCECKNASELGCADGATVNSDCECECPVGQSEDAGLCCPDDQRNDGGLGECCPEGEFNDGSGCECPDTLNQSEIDQVCEGAGQRFEGPCGCQDCPNGTQATDDNRDCFCPFTQNSDGSDKSGLCEGTGEYLDPSNPCPGGCSTCDGNYEVNAARDDCYCPLFQDDSGGSVDPTLSCTGEREYVETDRCKCTTCPQGRVAVDGNAGTSNSNGCRCPTTRQERSDACPSGRVFRSCGWCSNSCPGNQLALDDESGCYCPYFGDSSGGSTPELNCADSSRVVDPNVANCRCLTCPQRDGNGAVFNPGTEDCDCPATNNGALTPSEACDASERLDGCVCEDCPGQGVSDASGRNCICPLDIQTCIDDNRTGNTSPSVCECSSSQCPPGKAPNAAGTQCVCIDDCSGDGITGTSPNASCDCVCPGGKVVYDNACVRSCCVGAGDTWVCDIDGRCPGESGYKGPHNPE